MASISLRNVVKKYGTGKSALQVIHGIAAEIADRERIPRKFLEQILLTLKAAGLIASRRGREGGYELLKSPAQITVGQLLRIVDGPIAPLPCLSRTAYQRCKECNAD